MKAVIQNTELEKEESLCFLVSVIYADGKRQAKAVFELEEAAWDFSEQCRRETAWCKGQFLVEPLLYQKALDTKKETVLESMLRLAKLKQKEVWIF